MNKDKFWQLIDTMREGCNSTDEMYRKIFHILEQLPAKEVEEFHQYVYCYEEAANKIRLMQAANLTIGCSDDGFIDFRRWLISQGKEVYLSVLKNPDNIADLAFLVKDDFMDIPYFETLGYVGSTVYEKLMDKQQTSNNIPNTIKDAVIEDIQYHTRIDFKVDERDYLKSFPKLFDILVPPEHKKNFLTKDRLSFDVVTEDNCEIHFPMTKQQREVAGQRYLTKEMVTISLCSNELYGQIFEHLTEDVLSMKELNILVSRLNEMDPEMIEKLKTVVQIDEDSTLRDIINKSFNLNMYRIYDKCSDLHELGLRYVIEEFADLPEEIFENINLEGVGEDLHTKQEGEFIDDMYVWIEGEEKIVCSKENVDQMADEYEQENELFYQQFEIQEMGGLVM